MTMMVMIIIMMMITTVNHDDNKMNNIDFYHNYGKRKPELKNILKEFVKLLQLARDKPLFLEH